MNGSTFGPGSVRHRSRPIVGGGRRHDRRRRRPRDGPLAEPLEGRTLLNGSLDAGFGSMGGRATVAVAGLAEVCGVAVQPDGGVVVAGTVVLDGNDDFAVVRLTPDGRPDPSFGAGGLARIGFDLGSGDDIDDRARAVAVQADGTILVVGQVERPGGQFDFGIARLNADGSPDVAFGDNAPGRSVVGFDRGSKPTERDDIARAVAVQGDGTIVVVGQVDDEGDENDFGIARLGPDGRPDGTFGTLGRAVVGFDLGASLADRDDDATAVAIRADGRVVVAGPVDTASGHRDFGVARLAADGRVDPSFGGGTGRVVVGFDLGPIPSSRNDAPSALALGADGSIVVAGTVDAPSSRSDLGVVRLDESGAPDPAFGDGGKAHVHLGGGRLDVASGLALQPDGKILVAGDVQDADGDADFGAVRLDASGAVDASFGALGPPVVRFDLGPAPFNDDDARGAALDPDGRLVIAGQVGDGDGGLLVGVARLQTDSTSPGVARVVPVPPDPSNAPVDAIEVEFTEPIAASGVGLGALTLTRDGVLVPLGPGVAIAPVPGSATTFRISGLAGLTGADGSYRLTVAADGVSDRAGNLGVGTASATFTVDRTAPTVVRVGPSTAIVHPRPIESSEVEFTEPIDPSTFDRSALRLTRDGVDVPLGDGVRIVPVPGSASLFRVEGLASSTARRGAYRLVVDATPVRDLAGNRGVGEASASFAVRRRAVPADYDGDGTSDLATFRVVDGVGRLEYRRSIDGEDRVVALGGPGDFPIDADYDGDGIIDPAVYGFDPALGYARILYRRSSDGDERSVPFGGRDDFPIAGDYDGDGTTDLAVFGYSPANGFSRFAIVYSSGVPSLTLPFGGRQDFPVAGDFDGDGRDDPAVFGYSPLNGFARFGVVYSTGRPTLTLHFGGVADRPSSGDFDGDGRADFAVFGYSPLNGFARFGVIYSTGRPTLTLPFGGADDVPVGGDYDGDGTTDLAVFGDSPANGFHRFGIIPSGGSPTRTERYGAAGAVGLPPFSGLYRVGGEGAPGGSSPGVATASLRAASLAGLATAEGGIRPSPVPERRWADLFDRALRDLGATGPG